jgi:hypothetical protein
MQLQIILKNTTWNFKILWKKEEKSVDKTDFSLLKKRNLNRWIYCKVCHCFHIILFLFTFICIYFCAFFLWKLMLEQNWKLIHKTVLFGNQLHLFFIFTLHMYMNPQFIIFIIFSCLLKVVTKSKVLWQSLKWHGECNRSCSI